MAGEKAKPAEFQNRRLRQPACDVRDLAVGGIMKKDLALAFTGIREYRKKKV